MSIYQVTQPVISNDPISLKKSTSKDKLSFSPEKLFLSEMQKYKEKKMMTVEDRQHSVDWLRTIVASQKKHAKLIPPITLVPGDSEGITFVITKAKKIYGFLYGTMHNFSRGLLEAEILTNLSLDTQINLLSCSIIGTEVTVKNEPSTHSVEGALMAIADKCGIANIGVDDADRSMAGGTPIQIDDGQVFLPQITEPKFKKLDLIEELANYCNGARDARTLHRITVIALYTGIIEWAQSAALSRSSVEEKTGDQYQDTLQKQRHQSMADNIDALLTACVVIDEERKEERPPRGFFPLGISHLIPTPAVPESVVELLAKKGWKVERLAQEEVQLAFSREMTALEALRITNLIDDMHRHPLYAAQKPYLPTT